MAHSPAWLPPAWLLRTLAAATALAILFASGPALAYVGPGAGLTALGTLLALVLAVLLALVGVVWYPLKRLARSRAQRFARRTRRP